jgi:hypothetical protein
MRHYGIIIDDIPRHLAPNPDVVTHSIYIPDQDIMIPLEMRGIIPLFHTHRPSSDEIENCTWVQITSELDWDPHSTEFQDKETMESGLGSISPVSTGTFLLCQVTLE